MSASDVGSTCATSVAGRRGKRARVDAVAAATDTVQAMQKAALQELTEHLAEYPHKIDSVLRFAKMAEITTEKVETNEEDMPFHSSYRKLYRIPKEFLKSWLPTLCSTPMTITSDLLSRLERNDDGAIRNIFYVITNTLPESPWPHFAHDRTVFKQVFERVHREMGARIDKLSLLEKGDKVSIDTSRFGIYVVGPPGAGPRTYIEHINGERATVGSDFPIPDGDFQMLDNVNPLKACIKVKRSTAKCIDFFTEAQQDKIRSQMARMKNLIQDIANEVESAKKDEPEQAASVSSGGGGRKTRSQKPGPAAPPKASPGKMVVVASKAA